MPGPNAEADAGGAVARQHAREAEYADARKREEDAKKAGSKNKNQGVPDPRAADRADNRERKGLVGSTDAQRNNEDPQYVSGHGLQSAQNNRSGLTPQAQWDKAFLTPDQRAAEGARLHAELNGGGRNAPVQTAPTTPNQAGVNQATQGVSNVMSALTGSPTITSPTPSPSGEAPQVNPLSPPRTTGPAGPHIYPGAEPPFMPGAHERAGQHFVAPTPLPEDTGDPTLNARNKAANIASDTARAQPGGLEGQWVGGKETLPPAPTGWQGYQKPPLAGTGSDIIVPHGTISSTGGPPSVNPLDLGPTHVTTRMAPAGTPSSPIPSGAPDFPGSNVGSETRITAADAAKKGAGLSNPEAVGPIYKQVGPEGPYPAKLPPGYMGQQGPPPPSSPPISSATPQMDPFSTAPQMQPTHMASNDMMPGDALTSAVTPGANQSTLASGNMPQMQPTHMQSNAVQRGDALQQQLQPQLKRTQMQPQAPKPKTTAPFSGGGTAPQVDALA